MTLCLQMEQERHTDYLSSTKQTDKLKRALDVSQARTHLVDACGAPAVLLV